MRKIKYLLLFLLVATLCYAASLMISHQYTTYSPEDGAKTVSVLTYNTHRMGGFRKPSDNRVIHYIRRNDFDIVCLQEVEVYKDNHYLTLPELRDALRQYPYTYYDFKIYNNRRQFGNVVFSKYPLLNKQTIRYDSRSNISSRCDVVIEGDTLRLIVNHLESNRFTKNDFAVDTLNSDQLKASASRISEKLGKAGKTRRQQARILRQEINQSPYPVIVVGDFNAIPLSPTYWIMSHGLRDCFLESSRGQLGNTYVRHGLGIRIDYILSTKQIHPTSCQVDKVDYSDHYPVHATLTW